MSSKPCRYCGRRHEPIPHDKTIILGYYQGVPIIKAVAEVGTGFLTFYCEYCKREHLHGYGDGHRVAHCDSHPTGRQTPSPFLDTGYFLNQTLILGQPKEGRL